MSELQSNVVPHGKRLGGWQRKIHKAALRLDATEGQLDVCRRVIAHAAAWLGPENMQKIYLQVQKEIGTNGIDRNDGARSVRRSRNTR